MEGERNGKREWSRCVEKANEAKDSFPLSHRLLLLNHSVNCAQKKCVFNFGKNRKVQEWNSWEEEERRKIERKGKL